MVHSGGLATLLDLFEAETMTPDDGRGKLRTKAANFIYDRILSSLRDANGLRHQSGASNDPAFLKGLKPWCNSLTKALLMYESAGSSRADAVYDSIQEANQALEEAHARLRVCATESEL